MLLEAISGHTQLAGEHHLANYLSERKGPEGTRSRDFGERALGYDFVNVTDRSSRGGLSWAEAMDMTRADAGNERPRNGKPPLTYKHYVMSPDPKDDCSLQTLRECATEWARRWFSDYEVAIVYHDDNQSHILHAHIVVNNTNIETGRRLGPYLTKRRVLDLNRSAQEIALAHGLRAFDSDHVSKTAVEMGDVEAGRVRTRPQGRGPDVVREPARAASERDMGWRGKRTWKQDIADVIEAALLVAGSEPEFVEACEAAGVRVTESTSKRMTGDRPEFVFHHPSESDGRHGARCVRGVKLARAWSRDELTQHFALCFGEVTRAVGVWANCAVRVSPEARERAIKAMGVCAISEAGRAAVSVADFAAMMRWCYAHDVHTYESFARVGGQAAARMERIARACHAFDGEELSRASERLRADAGYVGAALAAQAASAGGEEAARAVYQSVDAPGGDVAR